MKLLCNKFLGGPTYLELVGNKFFGSNRVGPIDTNYTMDEIGHG